MLVTAEHPMQSRTQKGAMRRLDTRQGPCIEKVISKWVGEPDYAGCRNSQLLRYEVERDLRVF